MKTNNLTEPSRPALHFGWLAVIVTSSLLSACNKDSPAPSNKTSESPAASISSPQEKALAKFDDNKDGTLSKKERDEMNQAFVKKFDTDGDNKLSNEEKEIARRRSKVTVVPSNPRTFTKESAAAFLSRFDTDGDGKVSATEAGETRWKVMQRSDSDKDGLISSQEWFTTNLKRQKIRSQSQIPATKAGK